MKPILLLLFVTLPLFTYSQDADSTTARKNYNNVTVTAGLGAQWSAGKSLLRTYTPYRGNAHTIQVEVGFRKLPKGIYFSTGIKYAAMLTNFKYTPLIGQASYVRPRVSFFGVPLTLNLPVRLSDDVTLCNKLSAVPTYVFCDYANNQVAPFDLAFQYTLALNVGRVLFGAQVFRPLKSYNVGLASSGPYTLTGVMVVGAVQLL